MEKNVKVLIVDDDEHIQEAVKDILAENGYPNVSSAADGEKGVELALKQIPHLILMSLRMPLSSGGHAVGKLQESESTNGIPIVMMTGIFDKDDIKEGCVNINGRIYPVIRKPFSAHILLSVIEGFLKTIE